MWITEGALKADIAAEHIERVYNPKELEELGSTILGIPGVNTWRALFPIFKQLRTKHVNIAIDMDAMGNPYVMQHLKELVIELKKQGYSADMCMWDEEERKKSHR